MSSTRNQSSGNGGGTMLLLLLGAVALVWSGTIVVPGLNVPNRPVPPVGPVVPSIPAPSSAWQEAVAPITAKLRSNPTKARALASFYRGMAGIVERDGGERLKTGLQWRNVHGVGLDALVARTTLGDEPRVGREIDAAIERAIGLDPGPLDRGELAELVDALEAIAWACDRAQGVG